MTRVLITGMSGTGKSAVVQELVSRGYEAYDLDSPEWSEWIEADPSDELTPGRGRDWVWRIDRVRSLLSESAGRTLFVSGCAENMAQVFPLIDCVILLSAPVETVMERLRARSLGSYGSTADEQRRVRDLIATVEPLLRDAAHYEISSCGAVQATVDEVLLRSAVRRDDLNQMGRGLHELHE